MSKSPNDLNNYDDVSFDPITGETQTLTDVDNVYGEQQIGIDLLKNLEDFEAKTAPLSNPLSKSDFVDKVDNKNMPTLSGQKQIDNIKTESKKSSFHSSKTTTSQNNSLIKVVLSIAITLVLAAAAATYTFLSRANETSDLTNTQTTEVSTDQTQVEEQFVDGANEVASFVRNSASKLTGLTIEEALATNLNITYGRTWQILGWKIEQAEGNFQTVKFVYKQDGRKEISWKVDLQARKLIATSPEAETITLTTKTSSNNNNVIDGQSNQPTK
ncbi:MAG: hypothetical protein JNM06_09080 [Blastocatellia bacterium]|nr:hypothetical protein [Blastocatellia bacterium]MBN8723966.1 hypothetical protein [Acidobacteriota bacterium]